MTYQINGHAASELEALEQSMPESPEDVSQQYVNAERIFRSTEPEELTIEGFTFIDGKRRAKSKPNCNLATSTTYSVNITNGAVLNQPASPNAWAEACRDSPG